MPKYKRILIYTNCFQDFETEVGIYVVNSSINLVGEAILTKEKNNLYADLKTSADLFDLYPDTRSLGNKIDLVIFTKSPGRSNVISIREQLSNKQAS
ncbi:MAG TPA: hypothetical protein VMY77_04465 [Chitinophagaceae bacterium]|nr:hypothetical protein [Chitinophagaceae bacterium]